MTAQTEFLTVAICTYNGASLIPQLIENLDQLDSPVNFEILIVDNKSTDDTRQVIEQLQTRIKTPIRYVLESRQGIPYARNRAIEESLASSYMAFIDADELPDPHWLAAACRGLRDFDADCVGGKIRLELQKRPGWLADSLLPFLGQVDHGDTPLAIVDRSTPVWSGNVAYRTRLFNNGLRFDTRYNRIGKGVGGGSDGIMFRVLLKQKTTMRYEPDMSIVHLIPEEKLKRRYFLRLHYIAGRKAGMFEIGVPQGNTIFGAPRFMYSQLAGKLVKAAKLFVTRHPEYMREAMNLSYHIGNMKGLYNQSKLETKQSHV
ncbi:MAG: glycosyltransferase [Chromatiales bacterium]|jgi:glycosyltransferase involved in cell wall biosynthesis